MKEKWRKNWWIFLALIVIGILCFGIAYAWMSLVLHGKKEQVLKAAALELVLDESGEAINLERAIPLSDVEAESLVGYTFTLENTGLLDSSYTIYLEDTNLHEEEMRLTDNQIRFRLEKDGSSAPAIALDTTGVSPNRVLDTGSLKSKEKHIYTLKLWLKEDATEEVVGTTFRAKLRIEATQSVGTKATDLLIQKSNAETVTTYTSGDTKEMYTFSHSETLQQAGWTASELTDYRYIGKSPNNYIKFNDELWRVIGVFTVEDENGKKEQHVKIMRDDFLTPYLRWDSTSTETGQGKNRWSDSQLEKLLNPGYTGTGGSLYYNSESGTCYGNSAQLNGTANGTVACNYTNTGLKEQAKSKITTVKWYTAGSESYDNLDGATYYTFERGTTVYSSSSSPREISWIGKVGVIYPSDYVYTFANGVDNKCYTATFQCHNSNPSSSWMYNSNYHQWTLTQRTGVSNYALIVNADGKVHRNTTYMSAGIRPTVYLKSSVKITKGDGSSTSPYEIE